MCAEAAGFVGALCDLFVPTVGFGDRLADTWAFLQTRFPYSLAGALSASGSVGSDAPVAPMMGVFPIAVVELGGLFTAIRGAATVVILAGVVWFLVDRFTPQVTV